jgi:hypothetical protein
MYLCLCSGVRVTVIRVRLRGLPINLFLLRAASVGAIAPSRAMSMLATINEILASAEASGKPVNRTATCFTVGWVSDSI